METEGSLRCSQEPMEQIPSWEANSHSSSQETPHLSWKLKVHYHVHKSQWSRVPEKLIVTQLVKEFPAFYGTGRFITVFTTARLWSPSWANGRDQLTR
jgi:hypothetical protein